MRGLFVIVALATLAACSERSTRETYTCPNGPSLAVTYSDAGANITFASGRTELLPPTDREDVYAKPGLVWNARAFRSARLDDGQSSYLCDQMAG